MFITPYCPAAIIGSTLKEFGIPQETFVLIIGDCNTRVLSEFLSGKCEIPSHISQNWADKTKIIRKFVERLRGIPVDWSPKNAKLLRKMLTDFEKQLLLISVVPLTAESDTSSAVAQAAVTLSGLMTLAGQTEEKDATTNG